MMPRRRASIPLLGLATAVALSWLAMFLPPGNAWYGPRTEADLGIARADDGKLWALTRGRNAWHSVISYWHMQVSGFSVSIPVADYEARRFDFTTLPRHMRPDSLADLNMQAWYHRTGFPLPALACSIHWKTQVRNTDIIYDVRGGFQLPRDADFSPRALPLTPLWPGLLANSALYGAAWFAVLTGAAALRARVRLRRGLCPACAYHRAGLSPDAPCPECGARLHGSLTPARGRADGYVPR